MASAVVRAYSGGLGAEPPAGSRGRDPEALLFFWTFNGSRKFFYFSKIWKRKEITFVLFLQKTTSGNETGGRGARAKLGACAPPPPARA